VTQPSDITLLVPGAINPRTLSRLEGAGFRIARIASGDAALVTAELAGSVRGIAAFVPVRAPFIDALPKLEIVASFGVGYDAIDAKHCAKRGVMVTNTPDVLTEEVADTAIGLLINTVRELPKAEAYLRAGRWAKDGDYPLTKLSLRGRHIGIFGMGRIGRAIARRLEAMDLKVSYHNRRPVDDAHYDYYPSLVELAKAVDTLICVAPGGAATQNAVNDRVLTMLGANGIFINIGRGSAVDEPALIAALQNGTIRAAGLDVFADEPRVPQALLDLPNVSLLPHVGSASEHTRAAMADLVADNLIGWFRHGEALTPVSETADVKTR
jgi:lactate dehydrogenase-like 2-hydroxyacid dehydrogenase